MPRLSLRPAVPKPFQTVVNYYSLVIQRLVLNLLTKHVMDFLPYFPLLQAALQFDDTIGNVCIPLQRSRKVPLLSGMIFLTLRLLLRSFSSLQASSCCRNPSTATMFLQFLSSWFSTLQRCLSTNFCLLKELQQVNILFNLSENIKLIAKCGSFTFISDSFSLLKPALVRIHRVSVRLVVAVLNCLFQLPFSVFENAVLMMLFKIFLCGSNCVRNC